MLKGFIIIFTGVISYFYFKRRFSNLQCLGGCFVVMGLFLVGFSNVHEIHSEFAPNPMLGNILCLIGQLFLAIMFVYEEKILKEFDVHVFDIVGWEGIWGSFISLGFIALFYFIPGNDYGSFENPFQATKQVFNNKILLLALLVSIFVIGPFNYFGTSLTKYSTAMHRCLVDASRMCVVWVISMIVGWEHFKLTQCIGYASILIGNLLYFEVINIKCINGEKEDERREDNRPIENTESQIPIKEEELTFGEKLFRFFAKKDNEVKYEEVPKQENDQDSLKVEKN